jgi:hypothetical protein
MLHLAVLHRYQQLELHDYGHNGAYPPNTAVYRVTT